MQAIFDFCCDAPSEPRALPESQYELLANRPEPRPPALVTNDPETASVQAVVGDEILGSAGSVAAVEELSADIELEEIFTVKENSFTEKLLRDVNTAPEKKIAENLFESIVPEDSEKPFGDFTRRRDWSLEGDWEYESGGVDSKFSIQKFEDCLLYQNSFTKEYCVVSAVNGQVFISPKLTEFECPIEIIHQPNKGRLVLRGDKKANYKTCPQGHAMKPVTGQAVCSSCGKSGSGGGYLSTASDHYLCVDCYYSGERLGKRKAQTDHLLYATRVATAEVAKRRTVRKVSAQVGAVAILYDRPFNAEQGRYKPPLVHSIIKRDKPDKDMGKAAPLFKGTEAKKAFRFDNSLRGTKYYDISEDGMKVKMSQDKALAMVNMPMREGRIYTWTFECVDDVDSAPWTTFGMAAEWPPPDAHFANDSGLFVVRSYSKRFYASGKDSGVQDTSLRVNCGDKITFVLDLVDGNFTAKVTKPARVGDVITLVKNDMEMVRRGTWRPCVSCEPMGNKSEIRLIEARDMSNASLFLTWLYQQKDVVRPFMKDFTVPLNHYLRCQDGAKRENQVDIDEPQLNLEGQWAYVMEHELDEGIECPSGYFGIRRNEQTGEMRVSSFSGMPATQEDPVLRKHAPADHVAMKSPEYTATIPQHKGESLKITFWREREQGVMRAESQKGTHIWKLYKSSKQGRLEAMLSFKYDNVRDILARYNSIVAKFNPKDASRKKRFEQSGDQFEKLAKQHCFKPRVFHSFKGCSMMFAESDGGVWVPMDLVQTVGTLSTGNHFINEGTSLVCVKDLPASQGVSPRGVVRQGKRVTGISRISWDESSYVVSDEAREDRDREDGERLLERLKQPAPLRITCHTDLSIMVEQMLRPTGGDTKSTFFAGDKFVLGSDEVCIFTGLVIQGSIDSATKTKIKVDCADHDERIKNRTAEIELQESKDKKNKGFFLMTFVLNRDPFVGKNLHIEIVSGSIAATSITVFGVVEEYESYLPRGDAVNYDKIFSDKGRFDQNSRKLQELLQMVYSPVKFDEIQPSVRSLAVCTFNGQETHVFHAHSRYWLGNISTYLDPTSKSGRTHDASCGDEPWEECFQFHFRDIAVSPDGRRLAAITHQRFCVWRLSDGKLVDSQSLKPFSLLKLRDSDGSVRMRNLKSVAWRQISGQEDVCSLLIGTTHGEVIVYEYEKAPRHFSTFGTKGDERNRARFVLRCIISELIDVQDPVRSIFMTLDNNTVVVGSQKQLFLWSWSEVYCKSTELSGEIYDMVNDFPSVGLSHMKEEKSKAGTEKTEDRGMKKTFLQHFTKSSFTEKLDAIGEKLPKSINCITDFEADSERKQVDVLQAFNVKKIFCTLVLNHYQMATLCTGWKDKSDNMREVTELWLIIWSLDIAMVKKPMLSYRLQGFVETAVNFEVTATVLTSQPGILVCVPFQGVAFCELLQNVIVDSRVQEERIVRLIPLEEAIGVEAGRGHSMHLLNAGLFTSSIIGAGSSAPLTVHSMEQDAWEHDSPTDISSGVSQELLFMRIPDPQAKQKNEKTSESVQERTCQFGLYRSSRVLKNFSDQSGSLKPIYELDTRVFNRAPISQIQYLGKAQDGEESPVFVLQTEGDTSHGVDAMVGIIPTPDALVEQFTIKRDDEQNDWQEMKVNYDDLADQRSQSDKIGSEGGSSSQVDQKVDNVSAQDYFCDDEAADPLLPTEAIRVQRYESPDRSLFVPTMRDGRRNTGFSSIGCNVTLHDFIEAPRLLLLVKRTRYPKDTPLRHTFTPQAATGGQGQIIHVEMKAFHESQSIVGKPLNEFDISIDLDRSCGFNPNEFSKLELVTCQLSLPVKLQSTCFTLPWDNELEGRAWYKECQVNLKAGKDKGEQKAEQYYAQFLWEEIYSTLIVFRGHRAPGATRIDYQDDSDRHVMIAREKVEDKWHLIRYYGGPPVSRDDHAGKDKDRQTWLDNQEKLDSDINGLRNRRYELQAMASAEPNSIEDQLNSKIDERRELSDKIAAADKDFEDYVSKMFDQNNTPEHQRRKFTCPTEKRAYELADLLIHDFCECVVWNEARQQAWVSKYSEKIARVFFDDQRKQLQFSTLGNAGGRFKCKDQEVEDEYVAPQLLQSIEDCNLVDEMLPKVMKQIGVFGINTVLIRKSLGWGSALEVTVGGLARNYGKVEVTVKKERDGKDTDSQSQTIEVESDYKTKHKQALEAFLQAAKDNLWDETVYKTLDSNPSFIDKSLGDLKAVLHQAASTGNTNALKMLIETYFADPDLKDADDKTAEEVARYAGHNEAVEYLCNRKPEAKSELSPKKLRELCQQIQNVKSMPEHRAMQLLRQCNFDAIKATNKACEIEVSEKEATTRTFNLGNSSPGLYRVTFKILGVDWKKQDSDGKPIHPEGQTDYLAIFGLPEMDHPLDNDNTCDLFFYLVDEKRSGGTQTTTIMLNMEIAAGVSESVGAERKRSGIYRSRLLASEIHNCIDPYEMYHQEFGSCLLGKWQLHNSQEKLLLAFFNSMSIKDARSLRCFSFFQVEGGSALRRQVWKSRDDKKWESMAMVELKRLADQFGDTSRQWRIKYFSEINAIPWLVVFNMGCSSSFNLIKVPMGSERPGVHDVKVEEPLIDIKMISKGLLYTTSNSVYFIPDTKVKDFLEKIIKDDAPSDQFWRGFGPCDSLEERSRKTYRNYFGKHVFGQEMYGASARARSNFNRRQESVRWVSQHEFKNNNDVFSDENTASAISIVELGQDLVAMGFEFSMSVLYFQWNALKQNYIVLPGDNQSLNRILMPYLSRAYTPIYNYDRRKDAIQGWRIANQMNFIPHVAKFSSNRMCVMSPVSLFFVNCPQIHETFAKRVSNKSKGGNVQTETGGQQNQQTVDIKEDALSDIAKGMFGGQPIMVRDDSNMALGLCRILYQFGNRVEHIVCQQKKDQNEDKPTLDPGESNNQVGADPQNNQAQTRNVDSICAIAVHEPASRSEPDIFVLLKKELRKYAIPDEPGAKHHQRTCYWWELDQYDEVTNVWNRLLASPNGNFLVTYSCTREQPIKMWSANATKDKWDGKDKFKRDKKYKAEHACFTSDSKKLVFATQQTVFVLEARFGLEVLFTLKDQWLNLASMESIIHVESGFSDTTEGTDHVILQTNYQRLIYQSVHSPLNFDITPKWLVDSNSEDTSTGVQGIILMNVENEQTFQAMERRRELMRTTSINQELFQVFSRKPAMVGIPEFEKSSGRWYFEVHVTATTLDTDELHIGVMDHLNNKRWSLEVINMVFGIRSPNAYQNYQYAPSMQNRDQPEKRIKEEWKKKGMKQGTRISVAIDFDRGALSWRINGSSDSEFTVKDQDFYSIIPVLSGNPIRGVEFCMFPKGSEKNAILYDPPHSFTSLQDTKARTIKRLTAPEFHYFNFQRSNLHSCLQVPNSKFSASSFMDVGEGFTDFDSRPCCARIMPRGEEEEKRRGEDKKEQDEKRWWRPALKQLMPTEQQVQGAWIEVDLGSDFWLCGIQIQCKPDARVTGATLVLTSDKKGTEKSMETTYQLEDPDEDNKDLADESRMEEENKNLRDAYFKFHVPAVARYVRIIIKKCRIVEARDALGLRFEVFYRPPRLMTFHHSKFRGQVYRLYYKQMSSVNDLGKLQLEMLEVGIANKMTLGDLIRAYKHTTKDRARDETQKKGLAQDIDRFQLLRCALYISDQRQMLRQVEWMSPRLVPESDDKDGTKLYETCVINLGQTLKAIQPEMMHFGLGFGPSYRSLLHQLCADSENTSLSKVGSKVDEEKFVVDNGQFFEWLVRESKVLEDGEEDEVDTKGGMVTRSLGSAHFFSSCVTIPRDDPVVKLAESGTDSKADKAVTTFRTLMRPLDVLVEVSVFIARCIAADVPKIQNARFVADLMKDIMTCVLKELVKVGEEGWWHLQACIAKMPVDIIIDLDVDAFILCNKEQLGKNEVTDTLCGVRRGIKLEPLSQQKGLLQLAVVLPQLLGDPSNPKTSLLHRVTHPNDNLRILKSEMEDKDYDDKCKLFCRKRLTGIIINYKWERFASVFFAWEAALDFFYLAFFTWFSWTAIELKTEETFFDIRAWFVLPLLSIVYILRFLQNLSYLQLAGLRTLPKLLDHLFGTSKGFFNFCDLVISGAILFIYYRLHSPALDDEGLANREGALCTVSVVAIVFWFRLVYYGLGFTNTGQFVRIIALITSQLGPFLLVLAVIFLAAAHGLYLFFHEQDHGQLHTDGTLARFSTPMWSVGTLYKMLLGKYDYDLLTENRISTIYFLLFSSFVTITLLNILIAKMNDMYKIVRMEAEGGHYFNQAIIISSIETNFQAILRRKNAYANHRDFGAWLIQTLNIESNNKEQEIYDIRQIKEALEKSKKNFAKMSSDTQDKAQRARDQTGRTAGDEENLNNEQQEREEELRQREQELELDLPLTGTAEYFSEVHLRRSMKKVAGDKLEVANLDENLTKLVEAMDTSRVKAELLMEMWEEQADQEGRIVHKATTIAPQTPKASDILNTVVFEDDEREHKRVFKRQPLGFNYIGKTGPARVNEVHHRGHAEELGVKTGWKIKVVGGHNVEEEQFDVIQKCLKDLADALPHPNMIFVDGRKDEHFVNFTHHPLGFLFLPHVPLVVTDVKIGSQAQNLGLQIGWKLKAIDGKIITGSTDYATVLSEMKEMAQKLPEQQAGG